MDIQAVRSALADAADTISSLNCYGYLPDSVSEPAFAVGSVLIDFDETMNRGSDELLITCWLLVSRADDEAGQAALDGYLKGSGAASVKAALEVDGTLGGICDWVRLERVQAYRTFEFASYAYFGAQLVVRVVGDGD